MFPCEFTTYLKAWVQFVCRTELENVSLHSSPNNAEQVCVTRLTALFVFSEGIRVFITTYARYQVNRLIF